MQPQFPFGQPAASNQFNQNNLTPAPSAANQSQPPEKYVTINGVMKLNPEYKKFKEAQNQPATTVLHPEQALVVVSNMDDVIEAHAASNAAHEPERLQSEATSSTVKIFQEPAMGNEPAFAAQVGLNADELVDGLGAVFAKYEVPMGMMNKLLKLTEFEKLEFIVDDSGSMGLDTDTLVNGRALTRFEEARDRINSMIEILAYLPVQGIEIRFLNRPNVLSFQHSPSQNPIDFYNDCKAKVNQAFTRPSGGTPIRQALEKSMQQGAQHSIARYVLCDGEPSGGDRDKTAISSLLCSRQNPARNPVTFLSCTNDDAEAEWMKDVEEVAPFCAELDDFADEAREVAKDQGKVFPFSKGFHLLCQLVAAMNPDDLDALDESAPLTKKTLSDLMGLEVSPQEYHQYFDGFLTAQRERPIASNVDQVKRDAPFQAHFAAFSTANSLAKDLDVVRVYKQLVTEAVKKDASGIAPTGAFGGGQPPRY